MSKFLYLFIGMTSAIGGYQVSLAQYIIYDLRSTSSISIWIPIYYLISSSVVAILFPSFWTLYKLACSAMNLLRSLVQNIWKNLRVLTLQNFLVVHQTLPHQMTYQNQVGIHHPNNNYDHWFSFSLQVDSKYCLELFSLKVFFLWLSLTCSSLISSSSMSSSISSQ